MSTESQTTPTAGTERRSSRPTLRVVSVTIVPGPRTPGLARLWDIILRPRQQVEEANDGKSSIE